MVVPRISLDEVTSSLKTYCRVKGLADRLARCTHSPLPDFISTSPTKAKVPPFPRERISALSFRHAFETQHIMNGGDPFSLQKILGRSDITTTMIYVNLAGVGLRGAHAKASSVGRSPARD